MIALAASARAVIGSWAAIAASLLSAAGVILGYFNSRRITHTKQDVKEVHRAVNSTAMKQNTRTDQLTAALTAAGIPVPERPPDTPEELDPYNRKGAT